MHPDSEIRLVSEQDKNPELPTIPAELAEITSSIKGFLAKLEKIKFDDIGEELLGSLKGINTLVSEPELRSAISEVKESMSAFKGVMRKLDPLVGPAAGNLAEAMTAGQMTMEKLQVTLGLVDNLLAPESPMQYRIIQMADEMAEAARCSGWNCS